MVVGSLPHHGRDEERSHEDRCCWRGKLARGRLKVQEWLACVLTFLRCRDPSRFMTGLAFLLHASNCLLPALNVAWTRWSARVTLLSDGSSRASADPHSSTIRCIFTHATNRLSVGAAFSDFSRWSTHSAIQLENRSMLGSRRLIDTLQTFIYTPNMENLQWSAYLAQNT